VSTDNCFAGQSFKYFNSLPVCESPSIFFPWIESILFGKVLLPN